MKVPPGTKEYEESLRQARTLLNRLKKGIAIINKTYNDGEVIKTKQAMELWLQVSSELFTHLEMITLIHQQILTGNSVVVRADGSLDKVEDIMDMDPKDFDPWMLYSISKLYEIFGDEYKDILEIKMENPVN